MIYFFDLKNLLFFKRNFFGFRLLFRLSIENFWSCYQKKKKKVHVHLEGKVSIKKILAKLQAELFENMYNN